MSAQALDVIASPGHESYQRMKGLYQNVYDPFKLPEGNVLISFSGGRTSAYMLHKIVERNGQLPERVKVVFANTGREFPETLDFVDLVGQELGIKIIWVEYDRVQKPDVIASDKKVVSYRMVERQTASENGEPFLRAIEAKGGKFLPNMFARYCTQEMKFLTIKRMLVKEFGWKAWTAAIGVRNDEQRRARPSRDNRQDAWFPLNDSRVKQGHVLRYWSSMPFDLELTRRSPDGKYVLEGNCDCCFMKSEESLAVMYKLHPERFDWWEKLEERTGSFFYDKRKYKDLRERINQLPDQVFEKEGFFCQASSGECTDIDGDEQHELF